jgi:hypothetical protein
MRREDKESVVKYLFPSRDDVLKKMKEELFVLKTLTARDYACSVAVVPASKDI